MFRASQRRIRLNHRTWSRDFFGDVPCGSMVVGIPFAKHHFKQVKSIMNCKISQVDEKRSSLIFSTHPVEFGWHAQGKTESVTNINNNENSGFLLVYKPGTFYSANIRPVETWNQSNWMGEDIEGMKEFRTCLKNAGICLDVPASHFLTPHDSGDNNYSKWLKNQDLTKPFQTFMRYYEWS